MSWAMTFRELRRLLHYNPATGVFSWKVSPRNGVPIGTEAGTVLKNGMIKIGIQGRKVTASRLAWFYITRRWPPYEIDHKDTDRTNNKWSNLRLATRQQNEWNKPKPTTNVSGFKGVSWAERQRKYRAQITINNKNRHLGYYTLAKDAHRAYCIAARQHFGQFARFS